MKITIEIADDLLRRAEEVAGREKVTLQELAEEGLRIVLRRHEKRVPKPIRPVVAGGTAQAPNLSWVALQDLLYGDEGDRKPPLS